MATPTVLTRELALLVIQFLNEHGYTEAAHQLERESGFYFDLKYFEEKVLAGEWDVAERYLSGFTEVHENRFSRKIYFELRKQKFLEALDNKDRPRALDILTKDLKVFEPGHGDLFKEMTLLLTLNDIREHAVLSTYQDAISARKLLMEDINKVIELNPQLRGKLRFPDIQRQRLKYLLNQSLNWQHELCKNPQPDPVIQTLFVDHICKPSANLSVSQLANSNSLGRSAPSVSDTESSESSQSTLTDYAHLPTAEAAEEAIGNIDNISKIKPCPASNVVTSAANDYLPKTVVQTLRDDSPSVSMDFHPFHGTILLVGTSIGRIGMWEITSGEKLFFRAFGVWNIKVCSTSFKEALEKDSCASVNRILWSPDGSLFGVAFSKNIVQLYSYHGGNQPGQHLELEAHDGSVNDLAFSSYNQKLLVITCGDDKKIKTWDASSGCKCRTFEGHNASVYSIFPHVKSNIPFFFSTSVDGKIKAWLYDNMGARVDYDAPGYARTKLAYSADDTRIFSYGTGKDGEPYLVEWDESHGYVIRKFEGLKKPCFTSIHFDTTRWQLLAAGDDHMVKFWDMDNVELWTSTDADGDLPANPYICFNKDGTLLAVAAKENIIKILAARDDILQRNCENHSVLASTSHRETSEMNGYKDALESVRSDFIKEAHNKLQCSILLPEMSPPSPCQFLELPVNAKENKIVRLTYNHAGNAILALASNGIHLLWKWTQNDFNMDGLATTGISPHLWQPSNGLQFMRNDLASANPEDPISCFALSKNDSYLISGSGGVISLFNMLTFKTLKTLLAPPPAVTCLAFHHEDNNIIAIGMDNSSILIYNVRANKVKSKLEGHSKRVTSLAFSKTLDVLVSADVEAQILVWDTYRWVKEKARYLQMHGKKMPDMPSDTYIQFHPEQYCFLAVHGAHLAIYNATKLECVCQRDPEDSLVISQATFSCDGEMVFASSLDGSLGIFHASDLNLRRWIDPTAYLPTSSLSIYPIAIAAHPDIPCQFAVGLTNGSIFVFEPKEPGGKWFVLPQIDEVGKQQ